jgi:hypothetical protein
MDGEHTIVRPGVLGDDALVGPRLGRCVAPFLLRRGLLGGRFLRNSGRQTGQRGDRGDNERDWC